jgi:Family of unknown function (DUF6159)
MSEGRIARSWRLTRSAWRVVRSDRALLTLAAFSGVLGVGGVAVIFGVAGLVGAGGFSRGHVAVSALVVAYPLMFVSVFLNTAIAAAAAAALDGRRLSVGEALAVPARRVGTVALWALIAAGVGMVLEQIASRLPLVGSIVVRLVGVGWSLASLFAIPVLALEECSAPQCLRRSACVVKERWGEGIGGNVIISAWTALVMIPAAVVFAVALPATWHEPAARDAVILAGVLALVAIVAVTAVVRQTFAVALYRYATGGSAEGPFEQRDLQAPFSRKRGLFR